MNTTQTAKAPREIWSTSTRTGPRYFYWYTPAMRSFPMPRAQAELELATGQAVRIERPLAVFR